MFNISSEPTCQIYQADDTSVDAGRLADERRSGPSADAKPSLTPACAGVGKSAQQESPHLRGGD